MTLPSLILIFSVSLSSFIIGSACFNRFSKYTSKGKSTSRESIAKDLSAEKSCGNNARSVKNNGYAVHRNKRSAASNGNKKYQYGNAVYFSSSEIIRYTSREDNGIPLTPSESFTVELWVKPEGGQQDPTVIIGTFDNCKRRNSGSGWSVGIATFNDNGVKDARFYFALLTERSAVPTVIYSNKKYSPNEWVHIAAQFDTFKMRLLVNGVQVGVGHDQKGAVFGKAMIACKEIHVGGDKAEKIYFRGAIDELRVWRIPRQQHDIKHNMYDALLPFRRELGLAFYGRFVNLKYWQKVEKTMPRLVQSDIFASRHVLDVSPPKCGYTICDNPLVIRSYTANPLLTSMKTVKYRVVNVYDNDNNTNPTVSQERIMAQHRSLQDAFKRYNITWDLDILTVGNTSLRDKIALFRCNPLKVGNGVCNPECQYSRTGNDGGDCDQVQYPCNASRRGDSRCDLECNNVRSNWDDGDCCLPGPDSHLTCFDPSSANRGYMSVEELKNIVGLDGHDALNVYFASWPSDAHELIGVATFPWDDDVYSIQGAVLQTQGTFSFLSRVTKRIYNGILRGPNNICNLLSGTVIQPKNFGIKGKLKGLIHEFGHNLGLWHVHHGVSEMDCSDPCWETHGSLELGDLCEDTSPTPQNLFCHDPDVSQEVCGVFHHMPTPYKNFMSYAADDCIDHFTPHQVARMHCYLDLMYQPWQKTKTKTPAPPPLPPKLYKSSNSSVTMAWIPSIGGGPTDIKSLCSRCTEDGTIVQYAETATSSHAEPTGYKFSAREATGPPNAHVCDAIEKSWTPDTTDCQSKACYIELGFQYPVKAQTLNIWVNWSGKNGINDVVVVYKDKTVQSHGMLPTFCDIPLTITLEENGIVDKIIIYTATPYVAIDAVELISVPGRPRCQHCRSLRYRVYRDPNFDFGEYYVTTDTSFTDRNVTLNETYEYYVKALWGSKTSDRSPVLIYTHGQAYCGDGEIQGEEECDDGNLNNDDGCSIRCEHEEGFRCQGNPSQCYIHNRDGICEDFERHTDVQDCGFYVPEGFEDQWAVNARANPAFQHKKCPENVVIGKPSATLTCNAAIDMRSAWRPCMTNMNHQPNYWIEIFFAKPVVATEILIHIAADGQTFSSHHQKNITVDVIGVDNITRPLKHGVVKLSCNNNPASLPVYQDLSVPFTNIKGVRIRFQSRDISIAAVRLRSSKSIDPVMIGSCNKTELYNPRSGQCIKESCDRPKCAAYRIKYGTADCTGFSSGDICRISCRKGYYLENGLKEVRCSESGKWISGVSVECVPVDCGRPSIPHASTACRTGTTYGKMCEFKCNTKIAKLKGTDTTVRCEADGIWSPPQSYCQVFCPAPEHFKHAIIVTKGCRSGLQKVGDICKVKCKKGYHVESRPVKRRVMKVECNDDGEWIGERCAPVTCPLISPVYSGLYKCDNGNLVGSKCSLKCPKQTEAYTTHCLATGQWTKYFDDFDCEFDDEAACAFPVQKNLKFTCDGDAIGSICKVKCTESHHHPVISTEAGRQEMTKLQMADNIVNFVVCTGLLAWYPILKDIVCVPDPCLEDFIRDGFCDAKNNREFCQYDGGDCCDSTAPGGEAQSDYKAKDCKEDCQCKDPNAKENKREVRKIGRKSSKPSKLQERLLHRKKAIKKKHRLRRNRRLLHRLTIRLMKLRKEKH